MSTTILLDVDGVLSQTSAAMLRWAHVLGADTAITAETLSTYSIDKLLPEQKRPRFWDRVTARGFCAALAPYPTALPCAQALRELGDVVAVTAPMHAPHWADERRMWLREHFAFEADHIVSTSGKHWVGGDFLADDSAAHLARWSERWQRPQRAFLIDQPYNLDADEPYLACAYPRGTLADFVTYVRGFLEAAERSNGISTTTEATTPR